MSAADKVARALARIPSVRTELGVFIRMDGNLALVNIGSSTVRIPCVGTYPPPVGETVQIEWRKGRPYLVGGSRQSNPIGTITATGSPRATVTVDGVSHMLYYRDGYVPTVGDTVEINWVTQVIQGKLTGAEEPEPPQEAPESKPSPFDLTVRATNSGRYQNSWWGNDPWASNNNDGIWTYGNRVRDALKGAKINRAWIFLPLKQEVGDCRIGTHPHASIPGSAPSLSSLTVLPIGERRGWQPISLAFAEYLAVGGRGIGMSAPADGFNIWAGTDLDKLSGALRFTGTR
jgi:hypothetical protein